MLNANDSKKAFFEALKSSLKNEELEISAKNASIIWEKPYGQTIALLQEFESKEWGRLKIGRRGKETRFIFSIGSEQVAELELGKNVPIVNSFPGYELVNYPFFIRPNLKLSFQLPSDLSSSEAERIAAFIRTISLDKPHSAIDS